MTVSEQLYYKKRTLLKEKIRIDSASEDRRSDVIQRFVLAPDEGFNVDIFKSPPVFRGDVSHR